MRTNVTKKISSKALQRQRGQSIAGAMHITMELYHDSGRKDKSMVYEVLEIGERNALSPDYLRVTLGLTSNRAVQKQIEHERRQGKVILSSTQSPGGYFLPETKQEIRRFIRTLESSGNKTLDALDGARKLLEKFEKADKE